MIDEEINTYATRIAGNKYIFHPDNVAKAIGIFLRLAVSQ